MLISGRINAMHNTCEYHDFEFSAEVEIGSPFEKPLSRVCQSQRSMVSRDKAGSRGDRKRSLSDGISPNNLDELLPWERELLKRRSNIIPKDGYIPNSVIRKNLAFVRPVTPTFRKKDIWTLKPVPEPDPRHMPSGWGGRPVEKDNSTLDIFEIARRYRLETMESDSQEDEEDEVTVEKEVQLMPCMQNRSKVVKKKRTKKRSQGYESDESGEEREFYSQQRRVSLLPPEKDPKRATPFTWMDDDDAAPKSTLNQFQKLTNMVRASSTLSNASSIRGGYSKSSRRSTPVTPKYELKSKKFEFRNDLETPDSMRGVRRLTNSGGAQSRERSKSFKLTNMVVDEDSTDVRYKDPSGKRGSMLGLNDMDSIQKLLEEDWFSDMRGTPSFDSIMQRLLTLLDTDDPDLHSKICDYILDLHKDFGIPDMYLDRIIHKLSAQLGNSTPVPINNLRTLQQIGGNRPDVLATLLPRLIDSQSDVREEMVSILAEMIGVNNKDDLLQLMQDMGFKSKYNSKEEEEEALKALATRLDIPYRTDSFTDWISNWVDESSSLFHDDADLKEGDISKNWDGRAVRVVPESLCITETSSRASNRLRELTNISDKSPLPLLEKGDSVLTDITFDNITPSELDSRLTDCTDGEVTTPDRALLGARGPVLLLDDNPFPLLDDPDLHRPSFIEDLVQSYLDTQETGVGMLEEMSENEQDKDMAEYEKSSKFKEQVKKRRSEGRMEKFIEESGKRSMARLTVYFSEINHLLLRN